MSQNCNYMLLSLHIKNVGAGALGTKTKEVANPDSAKNIQKRLCADELYYLNTCNRVEILISHDRNKIIKPDMSSYKVRTNLKDIISHLLKVASGADSVLFGENQIITQFKDAMEVSRKQNLIGQNLYPLLQMIVRDAKTIKSKVKMTSSYNSVSSMAGHYIRNRSRGKHMKVLLVGFSNTNRALYLLLNKAPNIEIYWTNRTNDKIDADDVHKIEWEDFLNGSLPGVNVIVLATKCNDTLLTRKNLNTTNANLVVDLSVPSNASKRMVSANHADYIGISEINDLINQSQKDSKEKLEIIKHIIDLKADIQIKELAVKTNSNVVTNILHTSEEIYNQAMHESSNYLQDFDETSMLQVKKFSKHLVKKLNHEYLETLKLLLSR